MTYPVAPTEFKENPYQKAWFLQDYLYTQDGTKSFPKHHCKMTYMKSEPYVKSWLNAVDIGCRDGEYTRYLQNSFSHVFAFDARMRPFFAFNVDLSKSTHFTCGLSDTRETIDMFGGTHDRTRGKHHQVECYPLDAFDLRDISYIKIDVEGFERKVLAGAEQTILRERPLIVIEQNDVVLEGETDHFSAKKWLEERGYRHVDTCDRGWDYIMMADA